MRRLIVKLLRDDRGATAIEYGLICGLVFLVAVGAMNDYGRAMGAMFNKVGTAINGSLK